MIIFSCNYKVVIYRNIYKPLISSKNMEISDISHGKPSIVGEKPVIAWDTNDSSLQLGKEKINALQENIKEIGEMIENREKLSKQIIREAEKLKMDLENFIVNRDPTDEDAIKERNGLRQKQVEVSELQLKEKVSCWQDNARLKQELRESQSELNDKQGRAEMLSGILGE
jgi:hypothetical protein